MDAALRLYGGEVSHLWGVRSKGALVAVLGWARQNDAVVIHHIAVRPDAQGEGIGRQLLAAVVSGHPDAWLEAETDAEAVGFYRQCGIHVRSLGERYPGVERFLVRRPPQAPSAPQPALKPCTVPAEDRLPDTVPMVLPYSVWLLRYGIGKSGIWGPSASRSGIQPSATLHLMRRSVGQARHTSASCCS